ncbi:hypothetical protein [Clostridium sp. D5]|uniref:hypothetical protein n=1 Tax=Clostridium sp. D5 TaxID=556261 RepID=UPI0001FC850C|nr:hypothetical protein [Clostridium sp. D5]EGB90872.1 hypothetical protein HMPREF0240_04193 [Clostridium sp. D5]
MSELSLKERFSLIALNAQDSLHMTTAKKAALRCIAAAEVLEKYLDGSWPQQPVLEQELKSAADVSSHTLKQTEKEIKESLTEKDLLTEVPNLLACDMYYVTAGVNIFEYRCNIDEYTRQTEGMRAELMEDGNISDDVTCLLWLLRESGCFYDLFSRAEQEYLASRINQLYLESCLAKFLFPIEIHHSFEAFSQKFLKKKDEIFTTPFGTGLLFACPVFERSQSIFIEADAWFSGNDKRLECVIRRLDEKGHVVHVLRAGTVPLLKIDNLYYECIPTQIVVKTAIQGVRLRRYVM